MFHSERLSLMFSTCFLVDSHAALPVWFYSLLETLLHKHWALCHLGNAFQTEFYVSLLKEPHRMMYSLDLRMSLCVPECSALFSEWSPEFWECWSKLKRPHHLSRAHHSSPDIHSSTVLRPLHLCMHTYNVIADNTPIQFSGNMAQLALEQVSAGQ